VAVVVTRIVAGFIIGSLIVTTVTMYFLGQLDAPTEMSSEITIEQEVQRDPLNPGTINTTTWIRLPDGGRQPLYSPWMMSPPVIWGDPDMAFINNGEMLYTTRRLDAGLIVLTVRDLARVRIELPDGGICR
jgi:hypothetical protein